MEYFLLFRKEIKSYLFQSSSYHITSFLIKHNFNFRDTIDTLQMHALHEF